MEKQNLDKEYFWNELFEKYPIAGMRFCSWIDQYKKENDWEGLFGLTSKYIKYHDLPLAMQVGIWVEFISSYGNSIYVIPYKLFDIEYFKLNISKSFECIDEMPADFPLCKATQFQFKTN